MKLSDAIRLGAMLHPQCFGTMDAADEESGAIVATCALGGAMQAGYQLHPVYATPPVPCPVVDRSTCFDMNLYAMVTHLNDWHRWTREQIAAWVETIEAAEDGRKDDDERRRSVSAHATLPTTQVAQP